MMRLALLVGLLGVGCVGSIESDREPAASRPTDVTLAESAGQEQPDVAVIPGVEMVSPQETAKPEAAPAADAADQPDPVDPEPAQSAPADLGPEPTPNAAPAPGCVAAPSGGWVCEQACVSSWPVPSAVREDGWLDLYTQDGRQLCGGRTLSDGCGRTAQLTEACPGDDACGGEGTFDLDGKVSAERFICAVCRVETDPEALAVCGESGRPVPLVGCLRRAAFANCADRMVTGSDGRTRPVMCCPSDPR